MHLFRSIFSRLLRKLVDKMKKFLIVKTSSFGDIVQSFPAIEYLRKKFPEAQIDWVVEEPAAQLVQSHPGINRIIKIDTKKWRQAFLSLSVWREMEAFRKMLRQECYDCVFDLQSNVKSGIITLLARSSSKVGFGWDTVHEKANLFFTNIKYNPAKGVNIREDYFYVVRKFFENDEIPSSENFEAICLRISSDHQSNLRNILEHASLKGKKKVMVCPGSAWKNKQMTEEALSDFLRRLQEYLSCGFLFVWGNQDERDLVQRLQKQFQDHAFIVEKLPLPVLQNLMGSVDLIVAVDSLPLHLAGTTATPTFSVFGASTASKFKPEGKQHQAVQGICPYGRTFEKRCPILRTCPTGACIRSFTGRALFDEFRKKQPQV